MRVFGTHARRASLSVEVRGERGRHNTLGHTWPTAHDVVSRVHRLDYKEGT